MDEEPSRVTDPALTAVRDELAAREPIFHHPELGTSVADLDRQAAAEFEEVGASGRRYSRDFVLATVHDRFARGVPAEERTATVPAAATATSEASTTRLRGMAQFAMSTKRL